MFLHKYPWSQIHELNLDWIIEIIKELDGEVDSLNKKISDDIAEEVKEYIANNLDRFILGAMYIPENTAIKLRGVNAVEGDHIYSEANEKIIVLEGR